MFIKKKKLPQGDAKTKKKWFGVLCNMYWQTSKDRSDKWKWQTICTTWFHFYKEWICIFTYLKRLGRMLGWIMPSFPTQVIVVHKGAYIRFGRQKQNSSHYCEKVTVVRYGDEPCVKAPCSSGLSDLWPWCLIATLSCSEDAWLWIHREGVTQRE